MSDTPKTTEILPCPFCGGNAILIIGAGNFDEAFVRCGACQSSGPVFDVDDGKPSERERNMKSALASWNRRT